MACSQLLFIFSGKHTLVVADPENLIKSTPIVGTAKIGPVLFEV
jgi:hypothetical protein